MSWHGGVLGKFPNCDEDEMAKNRKCSTHSFFDAARRILNEACDVEYGKPDATREEVCGQLKDKDGLICLLTEKINEELLRRPETAITANVAVGFDNNRRGACTKRGGQVQTSRAYG